MLKTVGNSSTRYGDQTIVDGNLVIGTAGKGIDFSASSHASGMTGELLNDYEEGIWTPVITDGVNDATMANVQGGQYTKIGRQVFFTAFVYLVSKGSISGALYIKGLPYANKTDAGSSTTNASVSVGYWDIDYIAANEMLLGYIEQGQSRITMLVNDAASVPRALNAIDFENYDVVMVSGSYNV